MRLSTYILFIAISLTGLTTDAVVADELVMKTGERFSSDRVWEENGKIRFNLQGLLVSVDKDEVAAVIRKNSTGHPPSKQTVSPPRSTDSGEQGTGSYDHSSNQARNGANQQLAKRQKRPHRNNDARRPSQRKNKTEHGTGLKNVVWKMKPEAFGGLVKIETEPLYGGIDHYSFPEQPLKIGDALFDGVAYGFWRDQLYSIMMWVDGRIGYRRLKDELFHRFGSGSQNKPEKERYIWLEAETQRMLEFDPKLNMGIFVMRSSELDEQIKKQYPN